MLAFDFNKSEIAYLKTKYCHCEFKRRAIDRSNFQPFPQHEYFIVKLHISRNVAPIHWTEQIKLSSMATFFKIHNLAIFWGFYFKRLKAFKIFANDKEMDKDVRSFRMYEELDKDVRCLRMYGVSQKSL